MNPNGLALNFFRGRYPNEIEWFERFIKNGSHCPFARQAAKQIIRSEYARGKERQFCFALDTKVWNYD
jgi:hypothetical protein